MKDLTAKIRELDQVIDDYEKPVLNKDWIRQANSEDIEAYLMALIDVKCKLDIMARIAHEVLNEKENN